LAFLVFPYLALTTFVVGHLYRYLTDAFGWNSHSSELLEKERLKYGIVLFHYGIILTLMGHAGGLMIPQRIYDMVGIDAQAHTRIAASVGLIVGAAAFTGLMILMWRRITTRRVLATTTWNNLVTLSLLLVAIGTGLFNVIFGHYDVLHTIAPWIRGIVILKPDPTLMIAVPFTYKIHILSALALLGFSPFSRLVHIWSAPFTYVFRRTILFRRIGGCENA